VIPTPETSTRTSDHAELTTPMERVMAVRIGRKKLIIASVNRKKTILTMLKRTKAIIRRMSST
jgi:hypothetical protein